MEPGCYAVDDLPVLVDVGPDGATRARALDLGTGAFVDAGGPLVDGGAAAVEVLARPDFDRLVVALRRVASHDRQLAPLVWHDREVGDPEHHELGAEHLGARISLRSGDFPVEPRYVLAVGDEDIDHLDAWPTAWSKDTGLRRELRGVLDLAGAAPDVVRQHLAARAVAVTEAGPNLDCPTWADGVGPGDAFVELASSVTGARIHPPHPAGLGQFVDLFAPSGMLADVVAVAGPVQPTVKVHPHDPERHVADIDVGGTNVRVIAERRPDRAGVVVTVGLPPPAAVPSSAQAVPTASGPGAAFVERKTVAIEAILLVVFAVAILRAWFSPDRGTGEVVAVVVFAVLAAITAAVLVHTRRRPSFRIDITADAITKTTYGKVQAIQRSWGPVELASFWTGTAKHRRLVWELRPVGAEQASGLLLEGFGRDVDAIARAAVDHGWEVTRP